jgi:hypothetical protein
MLMNSEDARSHSPVQRHWKPIAIGTVTAVVIIVSTISIYYALNRNTAPASPFSPQTVSSVEFSLYYPINLPKGFKISKSSITSPQSGVVVMDIDGPDGAKIYLSQQARPSKFDFGGYYKNFTDSRQQVTDTGVIATGKIDSGNTVIGSLATNKTWILANTQSKLSPSDLENLLKGMLIAK